MIILKVNKDVSQDFENNESIWKSDKFKINKLLIKPQILKTENNKFDLKLTPYLYNLVKHETKGDCKCIKVLLRFCRLHHNVVEIDKNPPDVLIFIGDQVLCPKTGCPVNITPGINEEEIINIKLNTEDKYICLFFTAYIEKYDLCIFDAKYTFKCKNSDEAKQKVISSYDHHDSDVALNDMIVSVLCSLSQKIIQVPCVGNNCEHLNCFDLMTYLNMIPSLFRRWKCPICEKNCEPKNLVVDRYWMDILLSIPKGCTKVKIFKDGTWTPYQEIHEAVCID